MITYRCSACHLLMLSKTGTFLIWVDYKIHGNGGERKNVEENNKFIYRYNLKVNFLSNTYMSSYIKQFQSCSLETRTADSSRLLGKYPDRCCIIVGKNDTSDVENIDKHKYLVPRNLTIGQFLYVIRKKISCPASKSIFMFINNKLPPTSKMVGMVYDENKSEDGFLYITYSGENTFG